MTIDTPSWETDAELIEAARRLYDTDATLHAIAYMTATITVPDGENRSLTRALREVATQAAMVALLIERGPQP